MFSNWVLIKCLMFLPPKITSFINWLLWAFSLAMSITFILSSCFCGLYTDSISLLILVTVCSVSVICDFFFSKWIIEEPIKTNPIKQIYHVLKYAAKKQIPQTKECIYLLGRQAILKNRSGKEQIWWTFYNRTSRRCEDFLQNSSLPFLHYH